MESAKVYRKIQTNQLGVGHIPAIPALVRPRYESDFKANISYTSKL